VSTKQENIDDPNSYWNRAIQNEPIFILRSSDRIAPALIREWALSYKERKKNDGTYEGRERQKYLDALKCAEEMDAYFHEHF
jgi:hypothetical protein